MKIGFHTDAFNSHAFSFEKALAWAQANRYVRDLTCEERARYRVEPLCEVEGATATSER